MDGLFNSIMKFSGLKKIYNILDNNPPGTPESRAAEAQKQLTTSIADQIAATISPTSSVGTTAPTAPLGSSPLDLNKALLYSGGAVLLVLLLTGRPSNAK